MEAGRGLRGIGENLVFSLRNKFILAFVPSQKDFECLKSEDSSSRRHKIPEDILLHVMILKIIMYFSEAELWSFECLKEYCVSDCCMNFVWGNETEIQVKQ